MMRSHTQEAGAGYLIINGEVCRGCGKPFSLANYDSRVICDDGSMWHPECWEKDED